MPDVVISEAQQRALRSLMAAEPVPGCPLPDPGLLGKVTLLIPCDGIGVAVADGQGYRLDTVDLPRSHPSFLAHGVVDAVGLSFRNGPDLVVQLAMDRHSAPFTGRDLAILRLLEPVFERFFRERPTPHLPPQLTVQERRVLRLVATGQSNAQIGERLNIAPSTVRKHLEHIFPKLGVSNRVAAAVAFDGHLLRDAEPAT